MHSRETALRKTIELISFTQAKIFSDVGDFALYESLKKCKKEGFKPLFIPELLDFMLKEKGSAKRSIWEYGYGNSSHSLVTPSVKISGKSPQGKKVVAYAHIPTFFSNIKNFQEKERGDLYKIFGERETPQNEFEKILKLEDNKNVFVHDYVAGKQNQDRFELEEALEKTRLISLLGGRERAESFVKKMNKYYWRTIGIDDADDYLKCVGTVPAYGNTCLIDFRPTRISSWNNFNHAHFIGIKEVYPGLKESILDTNSLFKEVSELADSYVPEMAKKEFLSNLKKLVLNKN